MDRFNIQIGITSTVAAVLVCAATYTFLRYKYRLRDAVESLNYLIIKTVSSEEVCDEVVSELRKKTKLHRAIGFDCEWVTVHGKRHPVALMQLSTADGTCGLFRLNHMKTVPKSLKDLLEDETIYKVGVVPYDDAQYLFQDYGVELKSTFDIRHLAELCAYNPGGLAALSADLLRVVLDKSWRVRCSDWEAEMLTDRQEKYAAADAHVAIKMFVKLVQEYHDQNNSWFQRKSSNAWKTLDDLCWKYVDINFKYKPKLKSGLSKKEKLHSTRDVLKVPRKLYPNTTRKKPLYDNCILEAPDGEMLCTCDNKKAMWYVEKQLADKVSECPLRVRLRFEPAGRAAGEVGRYYQIAKLNRCVVCGAERTYIRKNVVPREYRKYFPEIMKEHSSHDVVLLCGVCHQTSNSRDLVMRQRLAAECSAPLPASRGSGRYTEDQDVKKIRSAARALQSNAHVLPEARRTELENVLLQYFLDHDEITEDLLQDACNLQVVTENDNYECHGQKVVDHFLSQEAGLMRLEQLWREHFLNTMRPQYMPELWSVTHNEDRLRVKFEEGRLSQEESKLIGL